MIRSWPSTRPVVLVIVLAVVLAIAAAALLCVAALTVATAGRPLATEDLWFHLKMGEVYATQGLSPPTDPMLHTAGSRAPVRHEWLFGVLVFGIERAGGYYALRLCHALSAAGILLLAYRALRRESGTALPAVAAALCFTVLSWTRLIQLRPDLFTIAATLLIYQLLLRDPLGPRRSALLLSSLLFVLWVNIHSLFAIGLALGCAALLGRWMQRGALRRLQPAAIPPRLLHLGLALAGSLALTLLNPRGVRQHLTFFLSSRDAAIWSIDDEWSPFHPFHLGYPYNSASLHALQWVLCDGLMLAFLLTFVRRYLLLRRARSTSPTSSASASGASGGEAISATGALLALDPPLFLLAAASLGAILISMRFLWLGIFPLLYVVRGAAPRLPGSLALCAFAVTTAAAFPREGGFLQRTADTDFSPRAYLSAPYLEARYCDPGVRFLKEAGLRGNLFNPYGLGGYLGYRLSPQLRTFIDGRTEHYPSEVMAEYDAITLRARLGRESYLDILERRRVDLFFAIGGEAYRYEATHTLEVVANQPGWLLIYRGLDHAIYLRTNERNQDNLRRVAAYYARQGIPFDPRRGFSVHEAIHKGPDWAMAQRLLPAAYPQLLAAARDPREPLRDRAQIILGDIYRLIGAREDQVEVERALLSRRPGDLFLRLRVMEALRQLGRHEEADALAPAGPARSIPPG